MACVCFGLVGCEAFNRRPAGNTITAGGTVVPADQAKRAEPGDPITGMGGPGGSGGYLAGRVINDRTGQPTTASIQFKCVEEGGKAEAPIEVTAGPDGYFLIQGLKPGKLYSLKARTQQGDRLLAGTTYKQASDMNVRINVREDFVSTTTPPIPAPPAYQHKKEDDRKESALKKPAAYSAEQPASAQVPVYGDRPPAINIQVQVPEAPRPVVKPAPQQGQWQATDGDRVSPPPDPTRITVKEKTWPPPCDMNQRKQKPPPPPPADLPVKSWEKPSLQTSLNTTVVPSCVLVGKQLVNFGLTDLDGSPWVFKDRKRGKLTLLDFWRTDCPPCLRAAPELAALESKYGAAGLEVIGIAYEQVGTPAEQRQRVAATAKRLGMNYQQLLGSGPQCPVLRSFQVTLLPTLRLIDQNGWIVWEHVGPLTPETLQVLEKRIQLRLNAS
jgi:thiol-disulfide isomerase/thioredoxin